MAQRLWTQDLIIDGILEVEQYSSQSGRQQSEALALTSAQPNIAHEPGEDGLPEDSVADSSKSSEPATLTKSQTGALSKYSSHKIHKLRFEARWDWIKSDKLINRETALLLAKIITIYMELACFNQGTKTRTIADYGHNSGDDLGRVWLRDCFALLPMNLHQWVTRRVTEEDRTWMDAILKPLVPCWLARELAATLIQLNTGSRQAIEFPHRTGLSMTQEF